MTNYDYAAAAEELGVTESWLRAETPRGLPHLKFGGRTGRVVFRDEHIAEIRRRFEVAPEAVAMSTSVVTRRRAS